VTTRKSCHNRQEELVFARGVCIFCILSCKQEFDEKLIYCVHSFPLIYDPSKKSYKDRIAYVNAWKDIATVPELDGKFIVSSVSPTFIQYRIIFYSLYCFNIKKIT
jgi:hypothetical protein